MLRTCVDGNNEPSIRRGEKGAVQGQHVGWHRHVNTETNAGAPPGAPCLAGAALIATERTWLLRSRPCPFGCRRGYYSSSSTTAVVTCPLRSGLRRYVPASAPGHREEYLPLSVGGPRERQLTPHKSGRCAAAYTAVAPSDLDGITQNPPRNAAPRLGSARFQARPSKPPAEHRRFRHCPGRSTDERPRPSTTRKTDRSADTPLFAIAQRHCPELPIPHYPASSSCHEPQACRSTSPELTTPGRVRARCP
jgi:hypothetical protein